MLATMQPVLIARSQTMPRDMRAVQYSICCRGGLYLVGPTCRLGAGGASARLADVRVTLGRAKAGSLARGGRIRQRLGDRQRGPARARRGDPLMAAEWETALEVSLRRKRVRSDKPRTVLIL